MARRQTESAPLSRFGVLVAQLESIVASAHQQPPDPLLCFDLLSALVATIEEESQESIVKWQRKCEDALFSLLVLGARRPVRHLASSAMARVIAKGDGISIYSRTSSLQGWLADSKRSEPLSCAGLSQCLGQLYHYFGRRIISGLPETANIAAKLMKFHEDFVRQDALQMLENALEGSGPGGASAAYTESFRIIMRLGVSDKAFTVRLAAARCLKTFASIGGPNLGTTELENSMSHCIKALEDPVSSVRDAFAEALGALLALVMNPAGQVNVRGKDQPGTAKKLDDILQKYLMSPFTRATGVHVNDIRIGLTLSWVFFLQGIHLKYHIPDNELQSYAVQAIDMLLGNASTDAHALACVLYILRVGAIEQMMEGTQRNFLVHLAKKLESAGYNPSAAIATLRTVSYLLTTLGEVPSEFKEIIDDTVVAALSHSSLHVRIEAALTLRAFAEVDPTAVGGLISYGVTTLYALRESATNGRGNQLNNELFSLHGQAAVIAALISISPNLSLGYPMRMPMAVLEVSKKMLTEFSRNPTAATVEMESGWLLLASIVTSMPKEELEDQLFDILLLWADPFVGGSDSRTRQAQDLTADLWVLTAAIDALNAFIRSFVSPTKFNGNTGILLQPVLAYLSGALSYLSSLASNSSPNLRPSVDLFTIRALMAYQSIFDPMAYRSEHPHIIQICTTPFREPSTSDESSCLKFLLDKRDACLGPWILGRDSFEDDLRSFDGGNDGLMPCVWEEDITCFPQACSISKQLVNQMLLCLGTMFACQDDGGKALLLTTIDNCIKYGKKQSWHLASITNACVALLAALKAMLGSRFQTCGAEILTAIQSIFQGFLAESDIDSAQRRASAEGLGLLARLGSDIFTARMAKNLLGELATATDSNYIGSVALSLGCIHRSVGGMALSTLVPATVTSISSMAKNSNANLQLWLLHALLLTIEAAGFSFVSQVQTTLFLVMEILLCEENGLVDLRQEIARIVNAVVAVLGPELAPDSTFFSRCKSVIVEISSCKEISTLLESVRFTQQLVLFAPQAVSVHAHVQSLLPTLSSRQPSLRYLAVSTLHHLIEKYPLFLNSKCAKGVVSLLWPAPDFLSTIDERIEEDLFHMLNEETDSEIGNLVRATISRLLFASCPTSPSRWLSILRKMVLSASTKHTALNVEGSENDHINSGYEGETRLYFGQDDEDMIASSNRVTPGLDTVIKRDKHLRYRTRLFAAECLSHLPKAVGTNAAHFDLSLARIQLNEGSSDWLVLQLQECISLSYQISTGQFVGMQSIGVELLSIIMDKFGKTQDPELPGHLLLEQYQAQLVSAVRSAISASSPVLLEAGLQLATKILTSGVLIGDRIAVSQMFSLISRPLNDIKDLYYPSFAEWVSCKIKVRLLAAHASIKCFVYQFFGKEDVIPDEYSQLASLLSSSSTILGKYWISILKDYAFIRFGLKSKSSFKPFLDGIQSPSVSSKVQSCLDEACPLILEATSLDAIPVRLEMEKGSKALTFGDHKKSSFISGYGMVRLEHQDFDFLWGLSWLILFQGQLPASHVKTLFCCTSNTYDDSFLVERNEPTSSEIALLVIHSLSKERFFSLEFVTMEMCKELFQFLIYAFPSDGSGSNAIVNLLSQIMQSCTDAYFEGEDFIAAAMELYFKCLLSAFHSNKIFSLNEPSSDGYISHMWDTAKSIIRRMKRKKDQQRMITALISTTYHCFRGASSIACFSKVLLFLQNLVTLLRSYLKDIDEAESNFDDYTDSRITMLTWARMLSFLSQECTKRINSNDKMNELFTILKQMLFSCLEEAIVLAKSVYQIQFFQANEEMLFSILRLCIRCIQDSISDNNNQVRAIGLTVLKRAVQQELTEVSNVKDHYFFMFFGGELLGEIYFLIQHESEESTSKESTSIIEESLTLLFLFYKLAQRIEQQQAVLMLLLEALIMVFSIPSDVHSQGVHDVKAIALRLVGHLVQISTSAIQLKDAMLSLPISHRQQVQDMIRASVGSGQATTERSAAQPETEKGGDHHLHGSTVATRQTSKLEEQSIMGDDLNDEDDEDDWDAFQSLPANTASASTSNTSTIETANDSTNSQLTEETTNEEEKELNGNHLTDAKDSKHPGSTRSVEPFSSSKAFAETYEDHNSDETNMCSMEKQSKQMADEQTTPLEDISKQRREEIEAGCEPIVLSSEKDE